MLPWSDQDGDELLSSDDGPDSEREGTKCEGEARDSEREGEGTDGEGEGVCLDRRRSGTTTEGKRRIVHGDNKAYAAQVTAQAFVPTADEVELPSRAMRTAI